MINGKLAQRISVLGCQIAETSNTTLLRGEVAMLIADIIRTLGGDLRHWEKECLWAAIRSLRMNVRKANRDGFAETRTFLIASVGWMEMSLAPWYERGEMYVLLDPVADELTSAEMLESLHNICREVTGGGADIRLTL